MSDSRWVVGDTFALSIPATAEALHSGGISFLTNAFHRFGGLEQDNRVAEITQFQDCTGGSTGRKLLLSVRYQNPQPGLPEHLFVKFSRDFDNPRRDRGKTQMELEVRFAVLAREHLPIVVPAVTFADYHRESGTGILITERIPFGTDPVEPHYDKCLDYRMPDALGHYEALLSSVARLAGAHRAGLLAPGFANGFGFDPARVTVGARVVRSAEQLRESVARLAKFGAQYPNLIPERLLTPEFVDRMADEVAGIAAAEESVIFGLNAAESYVALCHWNANVDNAWFWRDDAGRLTCGLLDWGCVSEMNVAMALWGALCSAEPELWQSHLDHLLTHFVTEFEAAGGPVLEAAELRRQLTSYALVMGVTWLLDAPAYISAAGPDLTTDIDRFDPRMSDDEAVRSQLLMLTNFLYLWQGSDFDRLLGELPDTSPGPSADGWTALADRFGEARLPDA